MKTIFILFITSCMACSSLLAQLSLQRQVVATAGDVMTGNTLIASTTIGEPATLTLATNNLTLTQGFQQPWILYGTPVNQQLNEGLSSTLYPNPTTGEVFVEVDFDERNPTQITLTDILGRPVTSEVTVLRGEDQQRFSLNLTPLPSGVYLVFLKQGERGKVVRVEKI